MKIISKNRALLGLLMTLCLVTQFACEDEGVAITEVAEPTLTDYSPKTGKPNTLVTITGSNFGTYRKAVKVTFGGVEAGALDSLSNDIIQVRVPYGVTVDDGEIVLNYFDYVKTFGDDQFAIQPGGKVDSIAPATGVIGDIITIYGKNFGTDASAVRVYFPGFVDPAEAVIQSVSDTEIVVEVPVALSGPLTVEVDPETFTTQPFVFPFVGIDSRFEVEDGGWVAQQGATQVVSNGELNVEFAGDQADLVLSSTQVIDIESFPFLAIRMSRLGDFDLQIETDRGLYGSVNDYKIVNGKADVFYWDLTSSTLADGTVLSGSEVFQEFRFNITSRSDEDGYFVDWIKSFSSYEKMIEEMEDELYPVGKLMWEFDVETVAGPDWTEQDYLNLEFVDHRNAPMWQQDGRFWATHTSNRLGFWRAWDASKLIVTGYPSDASSAPVPVDEVPYHPDYPIIAIKGEFWGATPGYFWHNSQGNKPGINVDGTFPDANQIEGVDGGVIWYIDGSTAVENSADYAGTNVDGAVWFDQWGFDYKVGANAVPGESYWMDWVISFRTVEELEEYAANH